MDQWLKEEDLENLCCPKCGKCVNDEEFPLYMFAEIKVYLPIVSFDMSDKEIGEEVRGSLPLLDAPAMCHTYDEDGNCCEFEGIVRDFIPWLPLQGFET